MRSYKICLPPKAFGEPEVLILGSLPGQKSLETGLYYANRGNRFWPMMAEFYGEERPLGPAQMDDFLRRHRIALWDVFASVAREGSSDSSMRNEAYNDIEGFLREHPSVKKILVAGKKAQQGFAARHRLRYLPVPSTSGANARFDKAVWRAALEI